MHTTKIQLTRIVADPCAAAVYLMLNMEAENNGQNQVMKCVKANAVLDYI